MAEEKLGCESCDNRKDFVLPEEIINALLSEKLVVFAGAGVSTETRMVYPISLYDEICAELDNEPNLSFAELMSQYCNSSEDGRSKLLQKIKFRFDYVRSFPELYRKATSFHRELSTIPLIKEIFTTNWDDLFERECGATPIVTINDYKFWNMAGRKIYKLHGSINNVGSIVATKEDYTKCYNNLKHNEIGKYLKEILTTKTVLFIGYSFGDKEFIQIYDSIRKNMEEKMPNSFVITLNENSIKKFEKLGLKVILTDVTYFLEKLKKHLVESEFMLDDTVFEHIPAILHNTTSEHSKLSAYFSLEHFPECIYSLNYQDGLIHAFERIISMRNSGEYSDIQKMESYIYSYNYLLEKKIKDNEYLDVSYTEGYLNGLIYLIGDDSIRQNLPLYYIYGFEEDILDFDEYTKLIHNKEIINKDAFDYAEKILDVLEDDVIIHHTPFLDTNI